ncbi:MAG: multicopper oxidase domain-containing protein, partial [Deltaproteobacteria bacterium]|nr:multicopper oxidase domain-containing protein [Deltaproteobacteria bacterium]
DYSKPTLRTIKGGRQPSISIRPGGTQLWRVGNVGANLFYYITIEGHEMVEVARDGEVRNQPVRNTSLVVPPGARTEFLVTGGAPGTYKFKTLALDTGPDGDPTPEDVLGTLVVSGEAETPITIPTTLVEQKDLRTLPITNHRRIVFTENNDAGLFYINGQLYSPSRDDVRVPLGAVEEWTLFNDTRELHTFHIHQSDFQLIEMDGVPQEFLGYQDTVDVPVGRTVKIILPFTNPLQVGRFVFHCHILEHEDGGMMQNIVVYDPANPNAVPESRMVQGTPCDS